MESICKNLLLLLCFSLSLALPIQCYQTFLDCLLHQAPNSNLSQLVYTQNNPSFTSLLDSSIQNLRFISPDTTKPLLILKPTNVQEVQASIICCKNHSLPIRVRSGGHDYEGLSYRSISATQFVMIDLASLRDIHVYPYQRIAWVQSGATLGELYYAISQKSGMLAFPAGTCPTVCVGGLFSGGGLGIMTRKFGLSVDNIIDAKLIDANGRVLNRESMGEDLFWAIRGGGGGSFGIVISWKIRLVQVPKIVSVFTLNKTLKQGAISLVEKWQRIAPNFSEDVLLKFSIEPEMNGGEPVAVFKSFYVGRCTGLLTYMQFHFPELGPEKDDCEEMSWIQSVVYFAGYGHAKPETVLLDRRSEPKEYNKGTSDFVTDLIPYKIWEDIFDKFLYEGAGIMYFETQGGRMSRVSDSDTPFPHRKGILYKISYLVFWPDNADVAEEKYLGWIREMRSFMTAYASKNPRGAYVNFRDLDLGMNEERNTNYENARVWGEKYFKGNFKRLALVKGKVDPENFFWHEQSIPPLVSGLYAES
ncbi:tetrahydrocannabinolic acid synthase-like protein [Carex littledalei]|uniref:Tetrahydrocannabinolic acid synthase-like protein n=1 Tax=Carex littledalei TaxID=544730 RepID=A0A833RBX4_9POAL|nr:tetrahydrocannabinolic acid synthase-like protein [Carex littledalei]